MALLELMQTNLVVELDVVEGNAVSSLLVDIDVGSSGVVAARGEPGGDGGVRDEERLGKLVSELLLESNEPALGLVRVHRRHVLVVNVDTVEAVLLDPSRELLSGRGGVSSVGSRRVGGSKGRDHERDASGMVLVEDLLSVRSIERLPSLSVVDGAGLGHPKGEDESVVVGQIRSRGQLGEVLVGVDDVVGGRVLSRGSVPARGLGRDGRSGSLAGGGRGGRPAGRLGGAAAGGGRGRLSVPVLGRGLSVGTVVDGQDVSSDGRGGGCGRRGGGGLVGSPRPGAAGGTRVGAVSSAKITQNDVGLRRRKGDPA